MSSGVRPSPWQAPYHRLHLAAQRRRRFTRDKLPKTKMAKSTLLFEEQDAKPANTPRGKFSPKPVASTALQPISIAASPPPAFPRISDAPWAFRPFRSHRRPGLGSFALSPGSAPQLHVLRPFHPGQRCGIVPFALRPSPPRTPTLSAICGCPSRIGRHGGCDYSIFSGNTAFVQLNRL